MRSRWTIDDLRERSRPSGQRRKTKRNLALLLGVRLLSGWRNDEVITMHVGPHRGGASANGTYTYQWTGKAQRRRSSRRGRCRALIDDAIVRLPQERKAAGRPGKAGPHPGR
jgi:hypothetical protein